MTIPKTLTDPVEVRNKLQAIADELGLPIEDERVLGVWSEKMRPMTDEVFDQTLGPLYFSKGKSQIDNLDSDISH